MYEMKALRSFEHGGSIKRGQTFQVATKKAADALEKAKLAQLLGEVEDEKPAPTRVEIDAAALLDQNAATVVAAIGKGVAPDVLAAALAAEKAGKDRKTVVEALEAAVKAQA